MWVRLPDAEIRHVERRRRWRRIVPLEAAGYAALLFVLVVATSMLFGTGFRARTASGPMSFADALARAVHFLPVIVALSLAFFALPGWVGLWRGREPRRTMLCVACHAVTTGRPGACRCSCGSACEPLDHWRHAPDGVE